MGVVVGMTSSFSIGEVCCNNASWNANPNVQRFYCLDGTMTELDMSISKPTVTVNATVYSKGPTADVSSSTDCNTDVYTIAVSYSLTACDEAVTVNIPADMMPTSYSYTKNDSVLPGEESWSLLAYVGKNQPTKIIRGIAEGSATPNAGVLWVDSANNVSVSTGNVAAQGIGRADDMDMGIVSQIGAGSDTAGDTGQASVSIQYTPLWL